MAVSVPSYLADLWQRVKGISQSTWRVDQGPHGEFSLLTDDGELLLWDQHPDLLIWMADMRNNLPRVMEDISSLEKLSKMIQVARDISGVNLMEDHAEFTADLTDTLESLKKLETHFPRFPGEKLPMWIERFTDSL